MGNVNQEAILFNDTFFNNISFGVEGATLEQVQEAARIANAHDFIMRAKMDMIPISVTVAASCRVDSASVSALHVPF